jgi:tripartite-type tricarboxylate transporter receptor subunit TctC
MELKTKKLVAALALTAVMTVSTIDAYAFNPTAHPVTVILPFAPGGGVDQTFRNLQKYAMDRGIELIPMYKPGAEGSVSLHELSTMPTAGYNISVTTAGVIAYHSLKQPHEEITIIGGIRDSIGAFVVSAKSPYNTLDDLQKAVKRGDDVKFGYGAPGQQMALEQFFELVKPKTKPLMVPYKGGGPVVNDLLAGTIDAAEVPFSIVKQHIDAGKLKLVATTKARVPGYSAPNIESKFSNWKEFDGFGVVAPKNTDPAAVQFWSEFLKEYISDKQVQEQFIKDYTLKAPAGPEALLETVKASKIKLANIKN